MKIRKFLMLSALVTVTFVSCTDEVTEQITQTSTNSLIRTEVELDGSNCANGGLAILTGLDIDNNGVLADSEIISTDYICNGEQDGTDGTDGTNGVNGEDGSQSLIKTTNISAGVDCANGGIKIETGTDTDNSGVLDSGEVEATSYICNGDVGTDGSDGSNGTNGSNGSDGYNSLIDVTEISSGVDCADGGYRIDVGLDTNNDGILDSSEITTTEYLCNANVSGSTLEVVTKTLYYSDFVYNSQIAQTTYLGTFVTSSRLFQGDYVGTENSDNIFSNSNYIAKKVRIVFVDDNSNGVADEGEIVSVNLLGDVAQVTVSNISLSATTEFPFGAIKTAFGADSNENGILDSDEELQVYYKVFNSATAQANPSTFDYYEILISDNFNEKIDYENSANNFTYSSADGIIDPQYEVVIRDNVTHNYGFDTNGNHILDTSEIISTSSNDTVDRVPFVSFDWTGSDYIISIDSTLDNILRSGE